MSSVLDTATSLGVASVRVRDSSATYFLYRIADVNCGPELRTPHDVSVLKRTLKPHVTCSAVYRHKTYGFKCIYVAYSTVAMLAAYVPHR